MMTAQEMKKLSDEAREKITADKTEKIYQKILEAAKNGKSGITDDGFIDINVKKELERMGYHVKSIDCQREGTSWTEITWGD